MIKNKRHNNRKTTPPNNGFVHGSFMVPPWFVHRFALFDGGTMEKAWTNHGESMEEIPRKQHYKAYCKNKKMIRL
jgi:hypothetical protein